MFKFMHAVILTVLMLAGATLVQAQCTYVPHNPSLVVSPSSVAIETEQTGQTEQYYILELDDQDEVIGPSCSCNAFTRQFCYRQETVSDPYAPNVFERYIIVNPTSAQCVNLKPPGCGTSHATIAILVQQNQGGTTPPHRYSYRTVVRASTNGADPILATVQYVYSRRDFWANTCQGQAQP